MTREEKTSGWHLSCWYLFRYRPGKVIGSSRKPQSGRRAPGTARASILPSVFLVGPLLCLIGGLPGVLIPTAKAETRDIPPEASEKGQAMHQAHGEFEVKLIPQADEGAEATGLGRMLIDKSFAGDLEGTSQGQMLGVYTAVKGSAGYVALEKVSATLKGRQGTFVLQHSSTLDRGEPSQSITVVPDSATGELVGLTGSMTIEIRDGKHFYQFEFALPAAP